jgi:hypothetical protein
VDVSNGDDDASKTDASTAKLKAPASDDAEGKGVSSAEPMLLSDQFQRAGAGRASRCCSGRFRCSISWRAQVEASITRPQA